ncbi:hypothetical protein BV22DRAFT_1040188 [Leucogyrophana mollusca]|uniref:Uncharacterized protein n=1 Tax=Leucogyrophana mollusca TaxID=85980 RepID=A0ACB8B419_9AGAM|nr:hypothetical protein BV22DRAFT_1040188 [Leucogyrophana mollusca]
MSGVAAFSSMSPSPHEIFERELASETTGRYIGPMPVDSFLTTFLPGNEPFLTLTTAQRRLFRKITRGSNERAMYEPFTDAIEEFTGELDVVFTGDHVDNSLKLSGGYGLKPDISIYEHSCGRTAVTDVSRMELWVEIKYDESFEPVLDPPQEQLDDLQDEEDKLEDYLSKWQFECETVPTQRLRGQMTAYALAQLGIQFRDFAFSVLIVGKYARLIRWDRAGAVVSRRFDYIAGPSPLATFFFRFARASPERRGLDRSVRPAGLPSDADALVRKALKLKPQQLLFEYTVPDDEESTRLRMEDPSERKPLEPYTYFGPRTSFPSRSLIGRSTRTLPVFDLRSKRVVFLKDTWRVAVDDIDKEGDTYRKLHRHKVPHIAPFDRGNDVGGIGGITVTQQMVEEAWACKPQWEVTGHIHYRMVLGVVGRVLTTFNCTFELVSGMSDAIEAHKYAYESAKVLHRDVSAGNIILTASDALLIDWDLSKDTDLLKNQRRRRDRTGTWQFMSAAILQYPEQPQERKDDVESFLHVTTHTAIAYTPSDMTPDGRSTYLRDVFDEATVEKGHIVGGTRKADKLGRGTYIPEKFKTTSPLEGLLRSMSAVIGVRYRIAPTAEKRAQDARTLAKLGDKADAEDYRNAVSWRYDEDTKNADSSDWLLDALRSAVTDRAKWPEADRAARQPITGEVILTKKQQSAYSTHLSNRDSAQARSYHPTPDASTSSKRRLTAGSDDEETKPQKVARHS